MLLSKRLYCLYTDIREQRTMKDDSGRIRRDVLKTWRSASRGCVVAYVDGPCTVEPQRFADFEGWDRFLFFWIFSTLPLALRFYPIRFL
jgi:hypothetical protein